MRVSSHACRWWGSLVLLAGCRLYQDGAPVDAGIDATPAPGWMRAAVIDATPTHDLDILFVIDDSAGMAAAQAELIATFPRMVNLMTTSVDGLPDLHVGVVSSDLGAGPFRVAGCTAPGDRGALQVGSVDGACASLRDRYISDVADRDRPGGRARNYAGTLTDTFACLADLGSGGCGFPQPLEALRRALDGSVSDNAGFLRPDAQLLIVLVSDQDDCSTRDVAMFDPGQDDLDDPLGPMSSFRCFEFGVVCPFDPVPPRSPGLRNFCNPREDSPYMFGAQPYVEFVRGLKPDLDMVTVVTIAGWADAVSVITDPARGDQPMLAPSCQAGTVQATPAIRLTGFTWSFPRSTQTSVCSIDGGGGIDSAAILTMDAMASSCVSGPVGGGVVELTEACRAFDVLGLDTPTQRRTWLPMCLHNDGAAPCAVLAYDSRCPFNGANAALSVERGGTALLPGTKVVLECPTDLAWR